MIGDVVYFMKLKIGILSGAYGSNSFARKKAGHVFWCGWIFVTLQPGRVSE